MTTLNAAQARRMLRAAIEKIEPDAVEFVDWDQFEQELEAKLAITDVNKKLVTQVFGAAVNRARNAMRNWAVMEAIKRNAH